MQNVVSREEGTPNMTWKFAVKSLILPRPTIRSTCASLMSSNAEHNFAEPKDDEKDDAGEQDLALLGLECLLLEDDSVSALLRSPDRDDGKYTEFSDDGQTDIDHALDFIRFLESDDINIDGMTVPIEEKPMGGLTNDHALPVELKTVRLERWITLVCNFCDSLGLEGIFGLTKN